MEGTRGSSQHVSPVKQAILELRRMRAKLNDIEFRRHEPVAVIGTGLRLPGGINDLDSYWKELLGGFDAIREVPPDRWDIDAFYDPDPGAPGKMYSRHGGFLEKIDQFDPDFFGISPREAGTMDPQQRLLLEVGWEALEMAGQSPHELSGSRTGIFLGIGNSDYTRLVLEDVADIDAYAGTGNSFSVAAGRLAYFLGLKGPCMAIDTACSSSLVALHLAVSSLRAGECDMALAGGVNIILSPHFTVNFCRAQMLSFSGRCRAFDAAADGYVRGEGCAVLALKRLSEATAHNDNILGVIRGSAVNQDGRSAGLTAPNGPSQEAVLLEALADAKVNPLEVGYIETHGTGTSLGDPIEARALGAVMGRGRAQDGSLPIGSVKTNIGHLEAAAGIAGVIKTLLVLKHGIIPPHLHFQRENPHISLDGLGLTIPTKVVSWPRGEEQRIAGVSSFGFSGTNSHVVLQSPPGRDLGRSEYERPEHLLTLSAANETALQALAERFTNHLIQNPKQSYVDTCFTANAGRSHFGYRLALIAENMEEAHKQLSAFQDGRASRVLRGHKADAEQSPEIAFLFSGQETQYVDMGRRLYETQPLFRKILKQCEELLQPHLEHALLEVMYPESGQSPVLDQAPYAQAALFALEYGLAMLWQSWGIEPSAVMGHGPGEYVAACVARVMSLEDALGLIFESPEKIAGRIEYAEPAITFISSLTAGAVGKAELDQPGYWRRPLCPTTRLRDSLDTFFDQGYRVFLEIGPDQVLLQIAQSSRLSFPKANCSLLPSLCRGIDAWTSMLETLGNLYVKGVDIDWEGFDRGYRRRRIPLPTYPFQRERYWLKGSTTENIPEAGAAPWQHAVESGRRQSLQVPIDLELHTYSAKWHALDGLTTAYIIRAFRELGIFTRPGERHGMIDLLENFHILPVYKELFRRWLERLKDKNLLELQGDTFLSPKPLPDPQLDERLKESKMTLGDIPFLQNYMERCGNMLIPVLTGRESALETLFPGGSSETGENLYQHWALSRYFNQISASIVKSFTEYMPGNRRVRILEVGAGTGGTTSSVLPILPPHRVRYTFTDVSEVFFTQAEKKFNYPFIRYSALDIEKSPEEQGYGRHNYDIVIAANVLHATRDLRQTMENVLSLLAPDGCFVLYEVTAPHSWFDITVGLIEGWQLFKDDLRTDGPLLTLAQWQTLFQSAGFSEVVAYPECGSPIEILNSHVIIGRAPSLDGFKEDGPLPDFPERMKTEVAPPVSAGTDEPAPQDFVERLEEATEEEQHELLLDFIRDHVSKILRRDPSKGLDRRRRLMDLGVDSLMAVELKNRIGMDLGLEKALPATLIFDYPSIDAVAKYLAEEVLGLGEMKKEGSVKLGSLNGTVSKIDELSEEEVEKMILEKLENM